MTPTPRQMQFSISSWHAAVVYFLSLATGVDSSSPSFQDQTSIHHHHHCEKAKEEEEERKLTAPETLAIERGGKEGINTRRNIQIWEKMSRIMKNTYKPLNNEQRFDQESFEMHDLQIRKRSI